MLAKDAKKDALINKGGGGRGLPERHAKQRQASRPHRARCRAETGS